MINTWSWPLYYGPRLRRNSKPVILFSKLCHFFTFMAISMHAKLGYTDMFWSVRKSFSTYFDVRGSIWPTFFLCSRQYRPKLNMCLQCLLLYWCFTILKWSKNASLHSFQYWKRLLQIQMDHFYLQCIWKTTCYRFLPDILWVFLI